MIAPDMARDYSEIRGLVNGPEVIQEKREWRASLGFIESRMRCTAWDPSPTNFGKIEILSAQSLSSAKTPRQEIVRHRAERCSVYFEVRLIGDQSQYGNL
jgi:hypothetical protein